MKLFNLKARLRGLERGRGVGEITLTFADRSTRSFNLSRSDRCKVMVASFYLTRRSRNAHAQPGSNLSPRAIELAELVARAVRVDPPGRLWGMVAGTVRAVKDESDAPPDVPDVQVAETQ
jgi:hypothetical protein